MPKQKTAKKAYSYNYSYGKRPMWQWIVIYLVIGGIAYALIYYFVFAKRGYSYNSSSTNYNNTQQQTSPY